MLDPDAEITHAIQPKHFILCIPISLAEAFNGLIDAGLAMVENNGSGLPDWTESEQKVYHYLRDREWGRFGMDEEE